MCGISCCYKCKATTTKNKRLLNRGPDHQSSITLQDDVTLNAYLLFVQGSFKQPCSREGYHLIYNGQLFHYPQEYESDTEYLLDLVVNNEIKTVVGYMRGPFAVIVYDDDRKLWFWRDYFGRRSLLISRRGSGYMLSSVGDTGSEWVEVPAGGVFCLTDTALTCFPFVGREDECLKFGNNLFDSVTISEEKIPIPVSSFNASINPPEILDWSSTCSKFLELLSESVRIRDKCCKFPLTFNKDSISDYTARHSYSTGNDVHNECNVQSVCNVQDVDSWNVSGARVAVLFSGGIDCTVLACLLDRSVPVNEPIDLLNVSFGKYNETPDRLSALASLQDLQNIAPHRTWNLIKVDVTLQELQEARERYITDLIHPHNTVLDDSIGCALWFAARGAGLCQDGKMISSARLLFSGIGADELMGGYSRHRGAWQNGGGLEGVIQQIQLDINRISERNLGRDNRVIGDHNRDCVAPFLDENFVSYINSLPIQYKVDFTQPRGHGEKVILRKVAEMLGLGSSSILPKKAIQFGSKIAKLEGRKEKGSEVCSRLEKKGKSYN